MYLPLGHLYCYFLCLISFFHHRHPWGLLAHFFSCQLKCFLNIEVVFPDGFPDGSVVKNPPANAGDVSLIPGSGRSPGVENGNPLQYSCLGNPMERGAWWTIVHGVAKSRTWLSTHARSLIILYKVTPVPLYSPFPILFLFILHISTWLLNVYILIHCLPSPYHSLFNSVWFSYMDIHTVQIMLGIMRTI